MLNQATHRALAWRLSNSLTAHPYLDAQEEAIMKQGGPKIMNNGHVSHNSPIRLLSACFRSTAFRFAGWQGALAE